MLKKGPDNGVILVNKWLNLEAILLIFANIYIWNENQTKIKRKLPQKYNASTASCLFLNDWLKKLDAPGQKW